MIAGSGRVSESACGCRLSFETGGGAGVDARGDSGGDGVVDVEGVEGGRWTIVVRVMGNRGRNRLMVSVHSAVSAYWQTSIKNFDFFGLQWKCNY